MKTALLPLAIFDQHCCLVGRTGAGKSYAARGIVEKWLAGKRRVCIIDPTGVWHGLRSSADGKHPGFPIIVFGGDHGDVPIGERSGARLAQIVAGRNLPAVVDTSEMTLHQRHEFMTEFMEGLYRLNKQALHFVIDEADEIAPQNPLPETRRMLGATDRIVRRGRAKGFRVMMITQRPAALHKNVMSQAAMMIAMKLPAPQDRKAVEDWIRGQADIGQASTVLESLPGLPRGQGWVWAPERKLLRRHTFEPIQTFDTMKAPEHGEAVSESTTLAAVELGDLRALLVDETEVSRGGAAPDAAALKKTRQEAYEEGQRAGRREVALALGQLFLPIEEALQDASRATAEIVDLISRVGGYDPAGRPFELAAQPPDTRAVDIAVTEAYPKNQATHPPITDLHPAAVQLLQVFARGIKLSWGQAATMAGRKARGGYFNAGRRALRDRHLVTEADELVTITAAGAELAGVDVNTNVRQSDVIAWWRAALPAGALKLFDALRECPSGMTKTQLGKATGLEPRGGYWNGGLAVLRNNDLIVVDGDRIQMKQLIGGNS